MRCTYPLIVASTYLDIYADEWHKMFTMILPRCMTKRSRLTGKSPQQSRRVSNAIWIIQVLPSLLTRGTILGEGHKAMGWGTAVECTTKPCGLVPAHSMFNPDNLRRQGIFNLSMCLTGFKQVGSKQRSRWIRQTPIISTQTSRVRALQARWSQVTAG
jgi:hypothetical protein